MPSSVRIRTSRLIVVLALVGGAVGVAAWFGVFSRPTDQPAPKPELVLAEPVPDPRLTFPTPFRNVKPGVKYVGDAACQACHADVCDKYHAHPMGRSAALTARAEPIERFDAAANNPFRSGPYTLRAEKTPSGIVHRVAANDASGQPLPEYVTPAHVAIGSGTRGRSYLSVEGGAAWQTPVSWFGPEAKWDLSPGFDLGNGGRRAISAECLFCHVDRVERVPGSVNRFREALLVTQAAVGCERCHGPGESHVAERTASPAVDLPDTTVVNPRHLAPELKAAVCEQCHLQGQDRVVRRGRDVFEFRPGLPFEQFVTVFTRHPDLWEPHKSVGQFEQIELSRCFAASGGRMVCTSCHDPHEKPAPAARDAFYRKRCLTCHESKGCSLPADERKAKDDSCVACHMTRAGSTNIPHTSVTDHRILRRPVAPTPPRGLTPGEPPLVVYRVGPHAPSAAERDRARGIALAQLADRLPPAAGASRQSVGTLARDRLNSSLELVRGDPAAWLALAAAEGARGDPAGWLEAAENAARLAPESEAALAALAKSAVAQGKLDRAAEAADRLVAMCPTAVDPLVARAVVRIEKGELEKAEADIRAALRLHPLHPEARLYLAHCLYRRGDPAAGGRAAEDAAALATSPQQRAAVLDWYRRAMR